MQQHCDRNVWDIFFRCDVNIFCSLRIHKDKSFHWEVCNVCLDKRLENNHKCRPDSGYDECCICLEVCLTIWNYSLCACTTEKLKLRATMLKPKRALWPITAVADNQINKNASRQAAGAERGKNVQIILFITLINWKGGPITFNRSLQLYNEKLLASLHRRRTKTPMVIQV